MESDLRAESNVEESKLSSNMFGKICRTCLSVTETLLLFDTISSGVTLQEMFKHCLEMEIEPNDHLPNKICQSCFMALTTSYSFKQKSQRSDRLLRLVLDDTRDNIVELVFEDDVEMPIQEELGDNHRIKLKKCSTTCESYGKLPNHRRETHPRTHNGKCTKSRRGFSHNLQIHKGKQIFVCEICQSQFSERCMHTMRHTGERPHTCDVCEKGFIQATSLSEHKKKHADQTEYAGTCCNMIFSSFSKYNSHIRNHDTRNECGVCHRRFSSKAVLKNHVLIHGEKNYLCSVCGRGFVYKSGLTSHSKVHTGLKPYPCDSCNKAFSQLGSLKSHQLIHTGEKPFVCTVCAKSFKQRNHLKYHMTTHSGEKSYVCKFCGKAFAVNGTLTVHLRTHTGETPFVCDVCTKGFYDSSSLKKHRTMHSLKVRIG